MTRSTMKIERFKAILGSYGTRSDAWPETERDAAKALIETSADAKNLFEDAGALDRMLDMVPAPQSADDAYLRRLAEIPAVSRPQTRRTAGGRRAGSDGHGQAAVLSWFRPTGFAVQLTGLAAAGILGLMLGFSNFSTAPELIEQIDASAYLFENPSILADVELVD